MGSWIRTRTIGRTLAVGLALVGEAWGAEPPAEETLEVPEVIVGATRLPVVPLDVRKVPANVTVITAEDIRRSGARTVQEALEQVPSIVMYDQNGNRFQTAVDLRGFNAQPVPAVSLFMDGVRVNEPDFNTTSFELIPLEDVERIEVIPGPGAIYGRNALAGVINIVTKRGGTKNVAVGEISGGSFGYKRFVGTLSGSLPGGFDYHLSTTREGEEGFRDSSDGTFTRTYAKIGYRREDQTDLSFSYTRSEANLKGAGSLTRSELDRDRTASVVPFESGQLAHLFTVNARQQLPWAFSVSLNGFRRFSAVEADGSFRSGGVFQNKTDTSSGGGTGQINHDMRLGPVRNQLSVGAEYRRDDINSLFPNFPVDQSFLQDLMGEYAQDTLTLFERITLTGGLRYDRTLNHIIDRLTPSANLFQRFERLTPRGGITANPFRQLDVYFNYAEGFRPPTFQEILGAGPFGSNLQLRPMRSRNFEVGLRARPGKWLDASLALFTNRLRDEILFLPIPPFGSNGNVPATRRRGIELTLRPRYGEVVDGTLTYTFTEATFRSNFPLCSFRNLPSACPGPGAILEPVREGDVIPQVPRHRLSAGVDVHPSRGLTLGLTGLWVGRQAAFGDEANLESKLPAYAVLNARVKYDWRGFTLFLLGNNITDARYSTRAIWARPTAAPPELFLNPAPGWSVQAGMSYRYELPSWK